MKKQKRWLVQLLHPDGPMGSWLCAEDPRKSLRVIDKKFGVRLSGRDYIVDVTEVEVFPDPKTLVDSAVELIMEIGRENRWSDWPPS